MASSIVLTINKSIHVIDCGNSSFTVDAYVNGRLDAQYGFGDRDWAEQLAKHLAENDRAYSRPTQTAPAAA